MSDIEQLEKRAAELVADMDAKGIKTLGDVARYCDHAEATPPAEPVVVVRDEPCNCPTFEHCDGSCAPYLGTRAEETSVSDAMVKAAITAAWPDGECIYDESFETIEDQMRAALTAALATKLAVKDDETVVEALLSWVCEDVLPAYGVSGEIARNDPELAESCRAALAAKDGRS